MALVVFPRVKHMSPSTITSVQFHIISSRVTFCKLDYKSQIGTLANRVDLMCGVIVSGAQVAMTKLQQWIAVLLVFVATWLALLFDKFPFKISPGTREVVWAVSV